jgi:DNA-binding CsgD family transcriptional regulator
MIQRAFDMTSDTQPDARAIGLVGFSEQLAGVETAEDVFQVLAAFVRAEGLGDLLVQARAPGNLGKAERWTTLDARRQILFEESRAEALVEDFLPAPGRPTAITWATEAGPGLSRIGDAAARERLSEAGVAGGVMAVMLLPSGRTASAHAVTSPAALHRLSELTHDLFLVASIHALLALDRAMGIVPPADLTRRELEALRLSARGLTICEVAERMRISEPTVKFHLMGARRKLNARTTREAVATLSEKVSSVVKWLDGI